MYNSETTVPLYIGTYTSEDSEGIYYVDFNTKTGELSKPLLVVKTDNPSFLAYSADKKNIFAVNENEEGTLSSFSIGENHSLQLLNQVSTHGAHPCHIAVNKSGNTLAVSNYTGGNASLHSISNQGKVEEAFQVIDHKGNSSEKKSHIHSALFDDNKLFIADLGLNTVSLYNKNHSNPEYLLKEESIVTLDENSGPRHFVETKNKNQLFIINELSSTITSAKKNNEGYEEIETVSTLRNGSKVESYCADIHLSADEKFLYGSNRGENTLVVFSVNKDNGHLTKIQNVDIKGDWPRNFAIDPSNRYLLVANQKSDNITVFSIDSSTGKLTFMNATEIDSPVFLLF